MKLFLYFIIKIEYLMKVSNAMLRIAFVFSRREKLHKPDGIRFSFSRTFLNTHEHHRVNCIPGECLISGTLFISHYRCLLTKIKNNFFN